MTDVLITGASRGIGLALTREYLARGRPVLVARRFLPLLRPGGRLVNITMPTRPVGQLTQADNHAFVASRYALNALTKMIALEVADTGPVVVARYCCAARLSAARAAW